MYIYLYEFLYLSISEVSVRFSKPTKERKTANARAQGI